MPDTLAWVPSCKRTAQQMNHHPQSPPHRLSLVGWYVILIVNSSAILAKYIWQMTHQVPADHDAELGTVTAGRKEEHGRNRTVKLAGGIFAACFFLLQTINLSLTYALKISSEAPSP